MALEHDNMKDAVARLAGLVNVARGLAPADLLITNAKLVNVFTGEVSPAEVLVKDGVIAGIGAGYADAVTVVDLGGMFLLPGLIDAHIHIESSCLTPGRFAEAAILHGTTTTISDPHEIVNVMGIDGYLDMVEASKGLPVDILYTVPSCVPATYMETNGADFGVDKMAEAFRVNPSAPALSEMMNYPGVTNGDPDTLSKILLAVSLGKPVDGHSPLLSGHALNAYTAAGPSTDHESSQASEAIEKVSKGMRVLVREGSTEKNLERILPVIKRGNSRWFCFASDDRLAADLSIEGEMDHILRRAVSLGLDPMTAIQMATINPALHYNLRDRGAIAPGMKADMVAVDDLASFRVRRVYKDGRLVVEDGKSLAPIHHGFPERARRKVILPEDLADKIKLPPLDGRGVVRVVQVLPDQIITHRKLAPVSEIGPAHDVLKAVVIERHRGTGNVGVGLVSGFGLRRGAIASTVAHDSHNLVVVGVDDGDIVAAARRVAEIGGGMAVVADGVTLAELPLPIAGLMSDMPADEVAKLHDNLNRAAESIGCALPSPFMTLSFLSLPVIPELRITDKGVVDVGAFSIVSLSA